MDRPPPPPLPDYVAREVDRILARAARRLLNERLAKEKSQEENPPAPDAALHERGTA